METRHRGFAGNLCVLSVFYVILGELWTNLGAGRIIRINTWYTAAIVANAGGFGVPTVSRSNSAGW